ncbi:MAG: sigma-70 family RNA polymerase sigma factor [Flavobacteriales bacterium]|nr:sigma-70 family RNA polymerase sigma factor [Flavobacteriales bacterium]MCB9448116.1 sigma-70 family RNA polymerase sigma factor [Flavobacteriales bacterium]
MRQLKISKQITDRSSTSVDRYLQDISRYSLITAEEETELAKRIHQGDQVAMEKLIQANLRFVVSVAKQYQHMGMNLADLINQGNIGLVKAAERFDETKGFKFISYAVWWIRQSILQALAEQSRIIRLPLNQIGSLNKINRAFSDLEQQFEREPTPEELAEKLESDSSKIMETLQAAQQHSSIDAPIHADEDATVANLLVNHDAPDADEHLMDESLKREIERALSSLTETEKDVIKLFFGIGFSHGLTLEEIGNRLHLTRERIRQIKERALRRLRDKSRSRVLRSFLGE